MRPLFFYFSLIFLQVLFFSSEVYSESSSEYVEKIHEDIVAVIIAKQGQYEEDPEEFIKAISLSLQPLVDFKRISRNVMGSIIKMQIRHKLKNLIRYSNQLFLILTQKP